MKHSKRLPLWAAILLDIAAAALLVGGWFVARIVEDSLRREEPIVVAEAHPASTPVPTPPPAEPEEPEAPEETEPPVDDRSEWQIRFADHFTPEVISSEMSYSGPNLAVNISHHQYETDRGPVVYHLAEIWMGNIDCFRSGLAATPPRFHMSASLQKMAEDQNAVVAVNGDFCSYSYGGIAVRNGVVWSKVRGMVDLCVLYRDGVMETIPAAGHTVVIDKAVKPTCLNAGKTEGSHCSACKTVLVAQKPAVTAMRVKAENSYLGFHDPEIPFKGS